MLISNCLAETAEAVQEAVETVAPATEGSVTHSFPLVEIVLIGIGLYELVTGLMTVFTGKLYSHAKEYEQYTPESLQANAKLIGLSNALLGLIMIMVEVGFILKLIPLIPTIVICALLLAAFIVLSVKYSRRIVKKTAQ